MTDKNLEAFFYLLPSEVVTVFPRDWTGMLLRQSASMWKRHVIL